MLFNRTPKAAPPYVVTVKTGPFEIAARILAAAGAAGSILSITAGMRDVSEGSQKEAEANTALVRINSDTFSTAKIDPFAKSGSFDVRINGQTRRFTHGDLSAYTVAERELDEGSAEHSLGFALEGLGGMCALSAAHATALARKIY